jgi:hypothetical protein
MDPARLPEEIAKRQEWNLVCTAYNLKRLHKLLNPANQKPKAPKTPKPMPSALVQLLGQLLSYRCLAFQ